MVEQVYTVEQVREVVCEKDIALCVQTPWELYTLHAYVDGSGLADLMEAVGEVGNSVADLPGARFAYSFSGTKGLVDCGIGAGCGDLMADIAMAVTTAGLGLAAKRAWVARGSLRQTDEAANAGVRTCLNSFTADTLVLMADGRKKPIKEVKLGDKVMATGPETGETGPRKVVDLIRHGGLHMMVAVRLSDGTTIDATDRHPFWVESQKAWVDAIELQSGDVVVTAGGERLAVTSLGISQQDLTAYNLTVAGLHTYFVGDEAVLVHNAVCSGPADSPIWGGLNPFKGKVRSNGLNGKNREYYTWDYTHSDIEVFNSRGIHLGSRDPISGEMYKPAVKGRTLER